MENSSPHRPMYECKHHTWPCTVFILVHGSRPIKVNMSYVYLLQSVENGRIYSGYTSDLKQRIQKHKSGNVHTTVRMGTVNLIYYEAFKDKHDATRREKY